MNGIIHLLAVIGALSLSGFLGCVLFAMYLAYVETRTETGIGGYAMTDDTKPGDGLLPCETCGGDGRVVVTQTHYVDRGTKWQQSFNEQVGTECPECNGTGSRLNETERQG